LQALNERKQGKERIETAAAMQSAADQIIQEYRVTGLLKLEITVQHTEKHVRAYGERPARHVIETTVSLQVDKDAAAIAEAVRWFGWQVYVTNQSKEILALGQAALAYREAHLVEREFGRLKCKPRSISLMYVPSDERTTGLVRLLSIGLRMLTVDVFSQRTGRFPKPAGKMNEPGMERFVCCKSLHSLLDSSAMNNYISMQLQSSTDVSTQLQSSTDVSTQLQSSTDVSTQLQSSTEVSVQLQSSVEAEL